MGMALKWTIYGCYGYTANPVINSTNPTVHVCRKTYKSFQYVNDMENLPSQHPTISLTASRVSRRRCLTNMRVRIVSGFKLALRSEIVSRPPENIRSTATAEPNEGGDIIRTSSFSN